MATKRALIVGINKYPYLGKKYYLRGCVNDAVLMKGLLVNKFHFEANNILGLVDEAATQAGIRAAMRKLEKATKKDDIVVFHYSGHGHRCRIKKGPVDEASGKDSCLLPYDDSIPTAKGKAFREIKDNEINAWLQRLAKKTPHITVIVDACHSGTITRGSSAASKPRSVPESARNQAPISVSDKTSTTKKGAGGWLNLSRNYVVISGCRDTQTSKERNFTEGSTNFRHGVLSYSLGQILQHAKPGTTYRDVFEQVSVKARAYATEQNPQIEGAMDKVLFGVKTLEPLQYIAVNTQNGTKIELAGGAAMGLSKGSRWTVYPPGTKKIEGASSLAVIEITKVGVSTSSAKVLSGSGVSVGARCVPLSASIAPQQLSVDLSSLTAAQKSKLAARITRSRHLCVADAASADVVARVVNAGASVSVGAEGAAPLKITSPSWVFTEDDVLAFPIHAVSENNVLMTIVDNLEKTARYRNTVSLGNPHSELDVEFNLFKRKANAQKPDEPTLRKANGGNTHFAERERMVWEIKNNEKTRSVFFCLVWVSCDKSIVPQYPPRRAAVELRPGTRILLGAKDKQKIGGVFDKNYQLDSGIETLKVFFTTEQCDYRWLAQGATRSSGKKLAALSHAVNGVSEAARSKTTKVTPGKNGSDWKVIDRSFILNRKKSR